MAVVAIKIKALPESPETNLEELKTKITGALTAAGAIKINSITEEPIAFGLIALIIFLAWPEEKDTSLAEDAVKNIPGVSSEEIIDYRRAFG
jgi:elongation factor 1-beta